MHIYDYFISQRVICIASVICAIVLVASGGLISGPMQGIPGQNHCQLKLSGMGRLFLPRHSNVQYNTIQYNFIVP